jgi:hypothetical protein
MRRSLVFGGFLHVIDDEEFARSLGRLEFQSELLLYGGKNRRAAGRV